MASNNLPQEIRSEKMLEPSEHTEHTEDKNLEANGARTAYEEEEPVVTFKTWIVVTVSA